MRPENCFWGYGEKYSMRPENWPPHLRTVSDKLQGVQLSTLDFEAVIDGLPDGYFVFADPPYFNADQQKFYSCTFSQEDHERLAACLERNSIRLPFLLTYDDHPGIHSLYGWADQVSSQGWNYTINRTDDQKNGKKKEDGFKSSRNKGRELFIRNYDA
jgi:DNA adenine methylase